MHYTNTRRMAETTRGAIGALLLAIVLAVAMSGTAMAFVPPGEGAEGKFGCGPAGHPGSAGQFVAMDASVGTAAWNAHAKSEQITNC